MKHVTHEDCYKFLDYMKEKKVITIDSMTPDQREIAEGLVSHKLLSKIVTRLTTCYTYGATLNGTGHEDTK